LHTDLNATEIDIPVAQSTAVSSVNAALEAADRIGYPVILRSAFTLGGLGSGFANDPDELRDLSAKSLSLSPQVLIERSMKGWKELEYEVVRDAADVGFSFALSNRRVITFKCRIQLFVVTWRTSTRSVHTLETRSLSRPRRPCQTMSIICCEVPL
jgi:biotin carboxylase